METILPQEEDKLTTERSDLFFRLLNCHSVCNNKTVQLNDYISSQNFDIFCITETWLGNDTDATHITALLPLVTQSSINQGKRNMWVGTA